MSDALEATRANVDRLVVELHRATGDLAELARAAGNEKLAAAAAAMQESLVQSAATEEPVENPFMTSHRAFLGRIRDRRRLSRGPSLP